MQNVTCWTCHHGKETPSNTITLDKLYGSPNDEHDDFVAQQPGEPKGAEVLDKYIAALGGAQKLATLKSFIASGTSVGYEGLGGGGSFQIFAKAPDQRTTLIVFKDHPERGDTHRVYDGKVGWNKTPRNAVPEYQLSGSELDGVRVDALLSFPGNIKTALTGLRTATADIGDRDVEVVQGSGPNGLLVTFVLRQENQPAGARGALQQVACRPHSHAGRLLGLSRRGRNQVPVQLHLLMAGRQGRIQNQRRKSQRAHRPLGFRETVGSFS